MNILIDDLFHHGIEDNMTKIDGIWYIKKPINSRLYKEDKFKSALAVLREKAFAVHYKEDET